MIKIIKCTNCNKQFIFAPAITDYLMDVLDGIKIHEYLSSYEISKYYHDCEHSQIFGKMVEVGKLKDFNNYDDFNDINVIVEPLRCGNKNAIEFGHIARYKGETIILDQIITNKDADVKLSDYLESLNTAIKLHKRPMER